MGDTHAPDQWALLAFANEALQASTNQTAHAGNSSSGISWSMVLKGFLPMLTIGLGLVGSYLMHHFVFLMTQLSEVETPLPGGVDSQDTGSEKYGLLEEDKYNKNKKRSSSPTTTKSAYITSSIRATIRQLNAEAGDLSMFRGIGSASVAVLVMMPVYLLSEFVCHRLPLIKKSNRVANALSHQVVELIGCQITATILHVCISKPRYKFWFRRMPMTWFKVLRTAWLAILVNGLSDDIIEAAFYYLTPASKPNPKSETVTIGAHTTSKLFQLSNGPLVKISVAIILWACLKSMLRSQIKPLIRLVLERPFKAIETRVFASMLSDDEDPVIPMDRNFQGRPQSGGILQHQTQPLGFREAARTIDKQTFIRLVKLQFKLHIIQELIQYAFWTLVTAEIVWFVGPSAVWVVLKLISGTPVVQADLDGVQGNATRRFLDNMIARPGNFTSPAFNMTVTALDQ
ncbi:hypothetical protein QM012_006704 [Aureobasidium pullulans]|uniref:ABC transmembrane type-1 domain-containing protein n=1 Tax=Aureobasidium pullulans TaxID=5580 RepID=A0ABR0TPV1_AURPU